VTHRSISTLLIIPLAAAFLTGPAPAEQTAPPQEFLLHLEWSPAATSTELIDLVDCYHLFVVRAHHLDSSAEVPYRGTFSGFPFYEGAIGERIAAFEARYSAHLRNSISRERNLLEEENLTPELQHDAETSLLNLSTRLAHFQAQGIHYTGLEVLADATQIAHLRSARPDLQLRADTIDNAFSAIRGYPKMPLTTPERAVGAAQSERARREGRGGISTTYCGPAGPPGERNCPPDRIWLPGAEPGSYWEFSSTVTMWEVPWGLDYTEGFFESKLRWSTNTYQETTINTAAYRVTDLPECTRDCFGYSAPCEGNNEGYVPNAAYESEGRIPNPLCWGRTGTPLDPWNHCFYPQYWESSFPDAYLDTTISDDDDTYNATVGCYSGELLDAGVLYTTYIDFMAYGLIDVGGGLCTLAGQIGTACVDPCWPPELCVFAVDTTILGRAIYH
jgi:hypothetical protein